MWTDPGDRLRLVAFALVFAVVGISVAAAAGAMAGTHGQPAGEELLDAAHERYASAESVVGTAAVTVRNGSVNASATVEYAATDTGYRVVVTRNDTTHRAGSNGSVAWYVGPNRTVTRDVGAFKGRAETAVSEYGGAASGYGTATSEYETVLSRATLNQTVTDNVTATLVRTGSDDGTAAYVVRVVP